MRRRAALAAAVALATAPAGAEAATEVNVIPHGQGEPGVSWAAAPGILAPETQALMYDRLTPFAGNVPDAALVPSADGRGYFKSARLLAADDPSLVTDETVTGSVRGTAVSARIRRDAYGVPHVYSGADDGVVFGAGYVAAQDRFLLIEQGRGPGIAAAIGVPGVDAIGLVRSLGRFEPTPAVRAEVTRRQDAALQAAGAEGRRVLRDIDTYLAGINTWYARSAPSTRPLERADIYGLNTIKAQYLGEGGGNEVAHAELLDALRDRLGGRRGNAAYQDLRARHDPESRTTSSRPAPWETNVPVARPRGLVRLARGSFRSAAAALARAATAAPRPQASNILLVSGRRSASGTPILAGGPQISYNYPGITHEIGLYGASIRMRGATAVPFPGYMLIGRGEDFAWTLTSTDGDIVDTYAETLCGGSRTRYRYKGRCRRMETVRAGRLTRGDETAAVGFRRTVHGPVIGYARVAGSRRVVALAQRRSTFGRETTDQLFFRRLTFGRVGNARQFRAAALMTPQTFNAFYADRRDIAFVTTGRLPLHRKGVNPDLPVDGRGRYEWRGFLPNGRHPQSVSPPSGLIVNWNNKPAPGFPASGTRFGSEGPIMRNDLLLRALAGRQQHTPATVLGAENAGAVGDPRTFIWPTVSAVLARGRAPSPLAAAMARTLDAWAAQGGGWVDSDGDGKVDAAGQAVIVAAWDRLADAALCGRLGRAVCRRLATLRPRYDAPPGSNQHGGWHQYMSKDLRTLLGRNVRGRYRVRYCGNGSVRACARALWAALEATGLALAAAQGGDPAAWRLPTQTIAFAPLPLARIQYTNRPSGIHQVMQF